MARTTENWRLALVAALAMGCTSMRGNDSPGGPAETQRVASAAAQPSPKTSVPDGPNTGAARLAGALVDARVLVITADGSDPAAAAVRAALTRLGTPFDVHDATHGARLTADQLAG